MFAIYQQKVNFLFMLYFKRMTLFRYRLKTVSFPCHFASTLYGFIMLSVCNIGCKRSLHHETQVLVTYLGLAQIVSDWSVTPIFQIYINISSSVLEKTKL